MEDGHSECQLGFILCTHMTGYMDSNQMGSFNGNTVKLREEATRGLKREDSAILTGLRLYRNFIRQHLGHRTT